MELDSVDDIGQKRFRTRWKGFDPKEVEIFVQQLIDEVRNLKVENAQVRKDLQEREKELDEFREREKTIRNVLMNAHNTVEQMKANAEKEAKLIVSEAEIKAENMLKGADRRLAKLQEEIAELKRHRIQFESRLRSTVETYRQLLDLDRKEAMEDGADDPVEVDVENR